MRKITLIILGVLLLIVSFFIAISIANSKKEVRPSVKKLVQTVFVDTVFNKAIPVVIPATGSLRATNRLEIFSEVQGIFQQSVKDFKPGQSYQKGQTLLQIDASEYKASVQSARSNLFNLITSIMPDLRLDYPNSYQKWQNYLNTFDVNKTTQALPEITSDQEKYFITGKAIVTTFFNIKNLEERLMKYRIVAPFNGILTEALVTKGTLIRPGQKLGEFIDPSTYEMEVAISETLINFIKVGKEVNLNTLDKATTFIGKISRINASIDAATQTVKVYIVVAGNNLREGMYLEANLGAKSEENAYQISRKLLVNENQIFIVRDSILDLMNVNPVYFSSKDVIVKGIPDKTIILSSVLPGAFAGQLVKIFEKTHPTTNQKP